MLNKIMGMFFNVGKKENGSNNTDNNISDVNKVVVDIADIEEYKEAINELELEREDLLNRIKTGKYLLDNVLDKKFKSSIDNIDVDKYCQMIFKQTSLNISSKVLFRWLRLNKYIHASGYSYNSPTSHAINEGILTSTPVIITTGKRKGKTFLKPLLTTYGQEKIFEELTKGWANL